MNVFSNFCRDNKLKINVDKTKALLVNMNAQIVCNGRFIENVNEFKYLGLVISSFNRSPIRVLEARISKAIAAFNVVRYHARMLGLFNRRVCILLVNSIATSNLLYGSVLFACLSDSRVLLRGGKTAFLRAELLLRKMLRWALKGVDTDTRSSFLYLLTNCTNVQVLAHKSCVRFFNSV